MAVRFKFRSSVNFDSVDIDGNPFISVRDLKFKIVEQKKLKMCEDVDLVISDADTGVEYEDESYRIPSGSSVIIKRVPGGRLAPPVLPHNKLVENMGTKKTNFIDASHSSPSVDVDIDNFDDFGVELYPGTLEALSGADLDSDSEKADNVVPSREPLTVKCHREPSDLSEAIPRGAIHCGIEGKASQTRLEARAEEHKKFEEALNVISPAMPITDLPSELRCSLCNTIFKEAVMIPCCQHSFCDKCIRLALVEKGRCPKCSSAKYRIEDLLPNVSLRQAIEHFLESQILISGSDNILPKYAPDGESGIQMKDVSNAVSTLQREPMLPHSPSATGRGSNQVMTDSASPSWQKMRKMNGERNPAACVANFKGRPSQTLPLKEEADSAIRRRNGSWVQTADEMGGFMATNRHRKGDRTCYTCGSPDHFMRDCPAASNPYPMPQTDAVLPGGMSAYGSPFWHPSPVTHIRPFANVYGTPGMTPFNPALYAIPSYMPSMYAGMPVPFGVMRMGGMAPPVLTGAERPLRHSEFMEFQGPEQRHKRFNEPQQRAQPRDGDDSDENYYYNEPERRSHDFKPQLYREDSGSYSEDTSVRRSQKKHPRDRYPDNKDIDVIDRRHDKNSRSSVSGRDHKPYHSEKSSSEIQDISDNSKRHSKEKHNYHKSTSKKHGERRSHKEVDSSRKRDETDAKRHNRKHYSHSGSCLEPSSSGDRKRQRKEKETVHSSRHSTHKVRSNDDQSNHDRWQMVDGLDEEQRKDYHHHKRKRIH